MKQEERIVILTHAKGKALAGRGAGLRSKDLIVYFYARANVALTTRRLPHPRKKQARPNR